MKLSRNPELLKRKDLRILLTNDDGIHAHGLEVLRQIAAELSDDVWVVAPETEQSGGSRSLTLSDPLRVRHIDERTFAVNGTPTDCVLMGVVKLVEGRRPDLVLSGVNHGQNIADDITYSGTVAGAMEGSCAGISSIALSQAFSSNNGAEPEWQTAHAYAPQIIARMLDIGWQKDIIINLNFPDASADDVKGVKLVPQSLRNKLPTHIDERIDARGNTYYWIGYANRDEPQPKGGDITTLTDGYVTLTPLHLNLTAERSLAELTKKFTI